MRDMVPVEGAYGPQMAIPAFSEAFLRRCFPLPAGDPAERNILDSRSKKQGKSTEGAGVALYMATRRPYAEVVIAAADKDQAKDRVLRAAKFAVDYGPLGSHAKVYREVIEFSNGSTILALPQDWRGAAGGNYSCVVFDELHTYVYENQSRMFDELVIPPTAKAGVRWIATYAGFLNESTLLWDWWQRALAGEVVSEDPPVYHNREAGLLALIDQGEASWRMPWTQGEEGRRFMAQQQASERPNTYRRLWLNEWVSAESQFIDMVSWDACEDPDLRPATPGQPIVFGADAAIKHDCAALVGCTYNPDRKRVELAYVKVWNPKMLGRLDPDATIGDDLRALKAAGHNIKAVYADPWQMETTMQTLKAAGINTVEFPQTAQRTEADQALYTAITSKSLATYPDPTLRQHVSNAVAVEGVRGFRLAKEKTTQKIDGAVALSMAHYGALAMLNQPVGVLQVHENPFYGAAPWGPSQHAGGPDPKDGRLFDDNGWRLKEHRVIPIDYHHCPDREPGCHPCWARAKALVAARDKVEMQAMRDELKFVQSNIRMFGERDT